MKLARVRTLGGNNSRWQSAVIFTESHEVAILPAELGSLDDLVRLGLERALHEVGHVLPNVERTPLADVELGAPLTRHNRDILCTGWNYWDHFYESAGKREGQDVPAPEHPTFFTKGPDVAIGPYDPIAFDPELSRQWDYEAEVGLVIGRDGRSLSKESALDHVFGYFVANDVSQRDLQRAHGGQWLKGKSIDQTMPFGPWITTADEVDPHDVTITLTLNGEVLQSASTSSMAFSIPTLLAELSRGMTVRAGDILLTGTPSGIGNAREPKIFLSDGDELVTHVSGLGELRNRVTLVDLSSPVA